MEQPVELTPGPLEASNVGRTCQRRWVSGVSDEVLWQEAGCAGDDCRDHRLVPSFCGGFRAHELQTEDPNPLQNDGASQRLTALDPFAHRQADTDCAERDLRRHTRIPLAITTTNAVKSAGT